MSDPSWNPIAEEVFQQIHHYRTVEVPISRADERRIRRHIDSVNIQLSDDPLDPKDELSIAMVISACASRGLEAGETDDGVWSNFMGFCYDLPREVRAPFHHRIKFAWRAAIRTWKST